MPSSNDKNTSEPRVFKGSRLRCLEVTRKAPDEVRAFLNKQACPFATVEEAGNWLPKGFRHPAEAKLGETLDPEFLNGDQREFVTGWWLAVQKKANTPNWDIASRCRIEGRPGLLLVEAKAHRGELSVTGKDDPDGENGERNHEKIAEAIKGAEQGLNGVLPGWALSRDSHYQLCNRFAWAWKLASMGVPVVLVYLGFLNAWDMDDGSRTLFKTPDDWRGSLLKHAAGVVPEAAWEQRLDVGGTPLIPIIRSAEVEVTARVSKEASPG
jgi:hypothetical protein